MKATVIYINFDVFDFWILSNSQDNVCDRRVIRYKDLKYINNESLLGAFSFAQSRPNELVELTEGI